MSENATNDSVVVKAPTGTGLTIAGGLHRKAALRDTIIQDILKAISINTANHEGASLVYGTPEASKAKLDALIQQFFDFSKECQELDQRITKTNILTLVEVEVAPNKLVVHTLQYWVRRLEKAGPLEMELIMWGAQNDRGLVDKAIQTPTGPSIVKVIRFYDPAKRDAAIDALKAEKVKIRSAVDNCNTNTLLLSL